ncbi:MAG TPA: glucose-1-phosphate adenylyltransferase, partial [Candidatus Bipolaricaulis anaerobius]|nr:glucose-1-phosphate adenylyltransferase [Candidatus Bipolaricaulis anaerobius]
SIVSGSHVARSVLSPGVRVNSYATVEDSVLLAGVDVGRGARIRRAIVDKGVRIPPGERIGYDPETDRARFTITEAGIVVLPKEARF